MHVFTTNSTPLFVVLLLISNLPVALTQESWTTKAPMHCSRADLGAAVVNGKIYAIGGNNIDTNEPLTPGINEEYGPTTDKWIFKTPTPIPTSQLFQLYFSSI